MNKTTLLSFINDDDDILSTPSNSFGVLDIEDDVSIPFISHNNDHLHIDNDPNIIHIPLLPSSILGIPTTSSMIKKCNDNFEQLFLPSRYSKTSSSHRSMKQHYNTHSFYQYNQQLQQHKQNQHQQQNQSQFNNQPPQQEYIQFSNLLLPFPPKHFWQESNVCTNIHCNIKYSLFHPQHHCIACGGSYCRKCVNHTGYFLSPTHLPSQQLQQQYSQPLSIFINSINSIVHKPSSTTNSTPQKICHECYDIVLQSAQEQNGLYIDDNHNNGNNQHQYSNDDNNIKFGKFYSTQDHSPYHQQQSNYSTSTEQKLPSSSPLSNEFSNEQFHQSRLVSHFSTSTVNTNENILHSKSQLHSLSSPSSKSISSPSSPTTNVQSLPLPQFLHSPTQRFAFDAFTNSPHNVKRFITTNEQHSVQHDQQQQLNANTKTTSPPLMTKSQIKNTPSSIFQHKRPIIMITPRHYNKHNQNQVNLSITNVEQNYSLVSTTSSTRIKSIQSNTTDSLKVMNNDERIKNISIQSQQQSNQPLLSPLSQPSVTPFNHEDKSQEENNLLIFTPILSQKRFLFSTKNSTHSHHGSVHSHHNLHLHSISNDNDHLSNSYYSNSNPTHLFSPISTAISTPTHHKSLIHSPTHLFNHNYQNINTFQSTSNRAVHELLSPALNHNNQHIQSMIQCENEIGNDNNQLPLSNEQHFDSKNDSKHNISTTLFDFELPQPNININDSYQYDNENQTLFNTNNNSNQQHVKHQYFQFSPISSTSFIPQRQRQQHHQQKHTVDSNSTNINNIENGINNLGFHKNIDNDDNNNQPDHYSYIIQSSPSFFARSKNNDQLSHQSQQTQHQKQQSLQMVLSPIPLPSQRKLRTNSITKTPFIPQSIYYPSLTQYRHELNENDCKEDNIVTNKRLSIVHEADNDYENYNPNGFSQ